ncbi:adenosylcobinamide-phosphate synthase CbiB [Aneurinibacillus terranovensis]|uniref:adenosylcobinamide-phosphate synthase CbiB n=1 Tax=Aneurinibacillus terranovensis TaxID=278991 RepID=UPI000412F62A|nr:adenosylcobinamide-phosphate synthase CbiB [Aneurinibacillus terranovensis]
MVHFFILLAAFITDWIVGDPRSIPHPVVYMGKCISFLEKLIRKSVNEPARKTAGILLPVLLVGGSYALTALLLKGLMLIHPWLAWLAAVWLISTTIATKSLADAGLEIYRLLKEEKIEEARKSLSMVVGRDTEFLPEPEIARATIETVAENIVDAIVSPLFYAAIGGAPLAMAYRAANTLDSIVGYKDERFINLGWASARFDDVVNYIPARLSAVMVVLVSGVLRLDWKRCLYVILRDARLHPSPNSGFTEAGVAGALGIQLGGLNYYRGVASHRAKLGDVTRPIRMEDIRETVTIMRLVSVFFLFLCLLGIVAGLLVFSFI